MLRAIPWEKRHGASPSRYPGRFEDENGCPSPEEMTELVLVDFDDTLVETAPAFQKARDRLFQR
ncbi:MAG: hypothetical protein R6T96_08970, partial [Longimicrobiales bacterium]